MKHLVLSAGLWKLKNSNDIKAGEKDLTREILMTLVSQGILTTTDCCTYTLAGIGCTTHAKTAYVDPNGNDETAVFGNPMCPYLTIQAALDATVAQSGIGETVKILPGVYTLTEPVDYTLAVSVFFDISAGVNIIGDDCSAFINTSNNNRFPTFTGLGKITVTGASNFCIEGGGTETITIRNIQLVNEDGGVIGGDWTTLQLSNTLMETDISTDCITSTAGVGATVFSINNAASSSEDPLLVWNIQGLLVDPLLTVA